MKITFVLPYAGLAGGIRVVAIYAKLLQKLGHDVFVVSQPQRPISSRRQIKSLLKDQKLISTKNSPSHFDKLDVSHKIIEKNRPITDSDVPNADVVVATWWETAEWVANLSSSKGAKAYFIQHHEVHDYLPIERVKATYSLPLHKITISKWLVDLMKIKYQETNISLVLNSVDSEQFWAKPRKKQVEPTVGMLYSTTYWKGCDVSFKALSIAREKIPNLKLVAFGAKEPSDSLPLPLNSKYFQQPVQNKIKDIYAECDVWLCGSYCEGFHLPPLEAMACRSPVVSTMVGGPMDTIKNGFNGYLVNVGDHEALANSLVKVISLPEKKWQAMSEAAYVTATNYTWEDATKLFEKALYTALNCQH